MNEKARIRSIGSELAHRLVTTSPRKAGLKTHSAADVMGGRARGIVCGGGPQSGEILALPRGVHAFVIGRTGSGKTREVLETTCVLNALPGKAVQPHIICLDCKGTILRETARAVREAGYRVVPFDLAVPRSAGRWNPLSAMHRALMEDRPGDADLELSRLSGTFKGIVRDDTDRYWQESAWNTIAGVAKGLSLNFGKEPSLGDVYDVIANDAILSALDRELGARSPAALHAAVQLTNVERTWNCVRSTCASMLAFFTTAAGRAIAGSSTVDFARDLVGSRKPRAFYIVIPDTSSAADNYAALLVNTLYQAFCAEHDRLGLEDTDKARPVLFILDEFARLPRMEISAVMSAGRSRDISVLAALQSVSQLTERGIYREEEARVMLEQAAATIYLPSTSPEAGQDAELKSGGAVGLTDLMLLERGEAYVALAGKPMIKTACEPFTTWAPMLGRKKKG